MALPLLELDGTWEEIAARLPNFAGRRLHIVVTEAEPTLPDAAPPKTNLALLNALHTVEENSRAMNPKPDTRNFLREGRAGEMFGYEPAE